MSGDFSGRGEGADTETHTHTHRGIESVSRQTGRQHPPRAARLKHRSSDEQSRLGGEVVKTAGSYLVLMPRAGGGRAAAVASGGEVDAAGGCDERREGGEEGEEGVRKDETDHAQNRSNRSWWRQMNS